MSSLCLACECIHALCLSNFARPSLPSFFGWSCWFVAQLNRIAKQTAEWRSCRPCLCLRTNWGQVRLPLRLVLEWSPLSALRGGDPWKIQCAVPLCLVISSCSLHGNGCIHLVDCRGGRRSCSVICKAVSADRRGIAAQWCLDIRNRSKPYVSRAKWLPASMGEPRLCDGCGFHFAWRSSGPHCPRCAEVICERFNALCHCVWWSRVAVCIGMAASIWLIAKVVGAVVVWFKRQWVQIAV